MRLIHVIVVFITAVFFFTACQKTTESIIPPTPVPIPNPNLASAIFGNTAATLVSTDAKVTVAAPANIFSSATNVSIEKTTEVATKGIGVVYKILPEGSIFTQNATITFSYTDADAKGTPPELMRIAFRKTNGAFELVKRKDLSVNKTNKTITATTNHFSDWVLISGEGSVNFTLDGVDYNDWPGTLSLIDNLDVNINDTMTVNAALNADNISLNFVAKNIVPSSKFVYPLVNNTGQFLANTSVNNIKYYNFFYASCPGTNGYNATAGVSANIIEVGPVGGIISGNFIGELIDQQLSSYNCTTAQASIVRKPISGEFIFLRTK